MKPLRHLHFQYDFTIKIIYSNIERYIKGKNQADCWCTLFDTNIILYTMLTVLSLHMKLCRNKEKHVPLIPG